MAKLHVTAAALLLAATLAGCGQGVMNAPRAQQAPSAQSAALAASLGTIRAEIKDQLEDGPGASTYYEIRKVDAKATQQRGVYAFKAWGDKIYDGDRTAVLITGAYNAKTQEIDDTDEEEQ